MTDISKLRSTLARRTRELQSCQRDVERLTGYLDEILAAGEGTRWHLPGEAGRQRRLRRLFRRGPRDVALALERYQLWRLGVEELNPWFSHSDPYERLAYVDPRVLTRVARRIRKYQGEHFLFDGPWDAAWNTRPLKDALADTSHWGAVTVWEIFGRGRPYRETAQYRVMVDRIQSGRLDQETWGCETLDDVERYFHELEQLYERMTRNGYRTQAELGGPRHDEVMVYVDRGGGLVKGRRGNHRWAMAQLLGIDSIPVLVSGVHTEWARPHFRLWWSEGSAQPFVEYLRAVLDAHLAQGPEGATARP